MRWGVPIAIAGAGGAAGLVAWVFHTEYRPKPDEAVASDCTAQATALAADQPITVVSWNVQFGASRRYHFFYDGGDAARVDPAEVERTTDAMADALAALKPDLTFLQEVDRNSARTGHIDELARIRARLGSPCALAAPYWRSPYVPTPLTDMLGAIEMDLALLSAATPFNGHRYQLALLDEPRLMQAFNLKRALLTAELPVSGSAQPLAVAVTHLSAFSYGDGTLERQVEALAAWMGSRPTDQPWILAGDLNLLPPGDQASRLGSDSHEYADDPNPMAALIPRFHEAYADPLAASARTYLPFGAVATDRKIDYLFYGGPVSVQSAEVVQQEAPLSDHLPLRVVLVIQPTDPPIVEPPPEADPE